ncbi:MAG: ABC transporter permease [Bacteroidetes bacterium]|nr:MAG: ABC transporter permease [Bacteroidota bacterium]
MDHSGIRSIPLVLLIGAFSGAIMAWQAAHQFGSMISLSVLGGQVTEAIMMEMAPVLTALVVSGRIGASMTAEIGSMKLSEQIDALRTMSIDPVRYLVLPRVLGLTLMMPTLTVFALVTAIIGAYGVSSYFLDLTFQTFFSSVQDFFRIKDFVGGLIKSTIFGMIISLVGCYQGIYTGRGASGLGEATIASFVISAVSILAGDFLLWIILF